MPTQNIATELAVIKLKITSLENNAESTTITLKKIEESQSLIREELSSIRLVKQGAIAGVGAVLLSLLTAIISLILK